MVKFSISIMVLLLDSTPSLDVIKIFQNSLRGVVTTVLTGTAFLKCSVILTGQTSTGM